MTQIFAPAALLPDGWAENVLIEIAPNGTIAGVTAGVSESSALPPVEKLDGPVLPGMPNLHSHAFQRAAAGRTQRAEPGGGDAGDDFWGWRRVMHQFASRLTPEAVEAIAAQAFSEMLEGGYTAVGEFHYIHVQPDGTPYADVGELSRRILAGAATAGIGITHLPVLYLRGGFDDAPLDEGKQRFHLSLETFLAMVGELHAAHKNDPQVRLGIAPHSLRAVDAESLSEVVLFATQAEYNAPVHIHIAEQTGEVEMCKATTGKRPVEWLLSNAPVGPRWCLVHATHMTESETLGLARSGAVAGICPTTEADLGDGLFAAKPYLAAGGKFGIGSDSHVSLSPIDELRLFEYGQRLAKRRRVVLRPSGRSSDGFGTALYNAALEGGAQALGRPIGGLAKGARADLVALDPIHPSLCDKTGAAVLDGLLFAPGPPPITDVMCGGEWVVVDGRHVRRDKIRKAYRSALWELEARD